MKKIYKSLMVAVVSIISTVSFAFGLSAAGFAAPEEGGEEEMEVEAVLMFENEETTLNLGHSSVSADMATGIKFNVINPQNASSVTYYISEMEFDGDTWKSVGNVKGGTTNLNGWAYVDFGETVYFKQGYKYKVVVAVNDNEGLKIGQDFTFEFNGSYVEPMELDVALSNGEEENTINSHSAVSIDVADGIVVNATNAHEAVGFTYIIKEMNQNEDAEGTFWTVGKPLADGEGNFNGGKGKADFEEPIYFNQGTKYQISVSVIGKDLTELGVYTYEINGSFAAEMEVATYLVNGEEENQINSHSSVTLDVANAIKVNVINGNEAVGITYAINEMVQNEDKEGTYWTVGKEIAVGESNLNGFAYAEFEEPIYFNQGTKYQVKVSVLDQNKTEIGIYTYEFNGSFAEQMEVETALVNGEEINTINDHSNVSLDVANAIKVNVINAPEAVGIKYVINKMKSVSDDEGTSWVADESYDIAVGESNLNGIAYAEFEDVVYFYQGEKYQVSVSVLDKDGKDLGVYKYVIEGSFAEQMEVETILTFGNEETTINGHSNVSVDILTGIKVHVSGAPEATGFSYIINEMNQNEDAEGTYWTVGAEVKVGEGNCKAGRGAVEFDEPILLAQGKKYQVSVTVYDQNGEMGAPYKYEINGSYEEVTETEPSLIDIEDHYALNNHSHISVASASALKVNFANAAEVKEASYVLSEMNLVAGEVSSTWEAGETLAEGELSINTIGYAEFKDENKEPITLTFEKGHKYQLALKVVYKNENEDNPTFGFDGSYVAPILSEAAFLAGDEMIALNDHSNISVESAEGLKVSFSKPSSVATATYTISSMVEVPGEESSTWDVNEEIAKGDLSINNIGYVGFEEPMIFERGTKYQVAINVTYKDEITETVTYKFNGAYVEPVVTFAALLNADDIIALNDHSDVSVATATNLLVKFGNPVDIYEVKYTISDMIQVTGDELSTWQVNTPVAQGLLSLNTHGYASFEEPLVFEQGTKYQLEINIIYKDNSSDVATYTFDGATAAPAVMEALLMNGDKEPIALNTKTAQSVEKMDAIKVTFGNPIDVESAMIAIAPMVAQESESGTTYVPGVPETFGLSINTIGYTEKKYTFEKGTKYQIDVVITYKDGTDETVTYYVDGATEKEEGNEYNAKFTINGTTMYVDFPVGTDLGDQSNAKPYILCGDNTINIADYSTDNTTGGFFDPLNRIIITLNEALADGNYTLVIPAGLFIMNGGDTNEEMRIPFTVGTTGIENINASANNGVMYNLSGVRVSNAKGIVIINGKKVIK